MCGVLPKTRSPETVGRSASSSAEAALGHKVGNVVEQADARSDLFEKRRALMESWARYLDREAGEVIELPRMA